MYCWKCGKEVNETPFCPYCGSKIVADNVCRYCGKETTGTAFCPYCGKPQNHSNHRSHGREKIIGFTGVKLAITVCVILAVLLAGILSISNMGDREERTTPETHLKAVDLILPAPDLFLGENANISNNTYTFELDDCPIEAIWEYTDLLEDKYGMKRKGWSTDEKNGANHLEHTDDDSLEVKISWTSRYDGIMEIRFYYSPDIQIDVHTAERKTVDSNAEKYDKAVQLYEKRDYFAAKQLFEMIPDYADSSKYLRLIRIRYAGTNIGVGSKVYRADCGLTESQKRDIDAAAGDFYFADTADVLVCNSDVASYYLIGEWNGGSKCYIHFIANNYGCRYNIGSKLSTNYQDTFAINDGIVYVDVVDSWTVTLKLTLLSPDCMEVYTYEKGGNCYVLTRQ